jgi:AAA domain, putative AbiEii toxin, Type IV TA system
LFETFGDDPNPLKQKALVLIDEIDAHMHPAWQRYLVSRIRSIFPRVQLIATTHSPLIVPSLFPNEIIRLERDTQTRQVSVSVPNYNVQDYRAEQILTSPLFGLESSLAPRVEEQVSRYTELAGKDELNAEEQHELERLSYNLNIKLPSPAETAEARIAYNMIQYALNKHLLEMDEALTEKVRAEMKVQLRELITGSRRP